MEEGDLLLCTVESITNTVTTVKTEDGKHGTIISSEIAPGRIKNMREYVVPNKKIVCKILRITGDSYQLSLRRVSSKEKKEVLEKYKQTQALNVAWTQIFKEGAEEIKQNIIQRFRSLPEFIDAAREEEKLLQEYIPKDKQEPFKKIIEKRKKSHELNYNLKVKCLEEDGLSKIKSLLDIKEEDVSVIYISAGNYRIKLTVEDFKEGKKRMHELIENLEKKSKELKCEFFATEEK
jgi:translation initiation factor 2 alpha subunit (eIF-2alpha)